MAHVTSAVRACVRSGKLTVKGESVRTVKLSERFWTKYGNKRATTEVIKNFIFHVFPYSVVPPNVHKLY